MTTGSCLCRAIQFTVTGNLKPVVACHCQQCRKSSGHYFAATAADWEQIELTGDVSWYRSSPTARRGFCPNCGSNLFWESHAGKVSILAGSLDAPTNLKLAAHIFCADKGDYYEIEDDLPQAPGRGAHILKDLR